MCCSFGEQFEVDDVDGVGEGVVLRVCMGCQLVLRIFFEKVE